MDYVQTNWITTLETKKSTAGEKNGALYVTLPETHLYLYKAVYTTLCVYLFSPSYCEQISALLDSIVERTQVPREL